MVTSRDRKSFESRRDEKIPKVAQTTGTIDVQAFWAQLHGENPNVQIFMNDVTNSLTWDVQFLSYWFKWNTAVFQD